MAGSLNRVQLIGHLGKDPEIRSTQSGDRCANLRIATSENWRDKQSGERRERTEWHTVVIWQEGLVKVAEQYLRKGSRCFVEGQLTTRKWQDQSGQDRYSTEVVLKAFNGQLILLDKRDGDSGRTEYGDEDRTQRQQRPPRRDEMDDEIPF